MRELADAHTRLFAQVGQMCAFYWIMAACCHSAGHHNAALNNGSTTAGEYGRYFSSEMFIVPNLLFGEYILLFSTGDPLSEGP